MEDEETRKTIGERHLEKRMSRSRRLTPRMSDDWNVAEKTRRVGSSRPRKSKSCELCDSLHYDRIYRLLQRNNIGLRGLDHLRNLLGATGAALANVVGEQPQSYSADFFNSTRYGWSIVASRTVCTSDVVAWRLTGRFTIAHRRFLSGVSCGDANGCSSLRGTE